MIRRILTIGVGVAIVAGLALAADDGQPDPTDPPLRLKKKNKPNAPPAEKKPDDKQPDEKKPDEKKPDEKKPDEKKGDMPENITKDGEPVDEGEDEKEVLERVAKNMKASEDRLVNKEINEGTRQIQEDIVKDLDSLIKSAENPDGGGGGGGEDADNQQDQDQQKQGQQGKQGGSKSKGQRKGGQKQQQARGQKQGGQKQQARGQQGNNPGQGGNQPMNQQANNKQNNPDNKQGQQGNKSNPNNDSPTREQPGDPNRDAEVFKETWGHLPEALRGQMDAYSGRQKYMDKHQDVIKQYYKTIAAQGRKKE